MSDTSPLIDLLISWLPILLLTGVFIYFGVKSQSIYSGKSGKSHGEMLEEHIVELRRQNDLLERIVRDQEARLQRLESSRGRSSSSTGGGASGGGGGGAGR
jgi:ribosomal protein L4